MNIMLVHLVVLVRIYGCYCARTNPACVNVTIANAVLSNTQSLEGVYTRTAPTCYGRYVYEREDGRGKWFLNFIDKKNTSNFQGWVLTRSRCNKLDIRYLVSEDASLSPHTTLGVWKEYNGPNTSMVENQVLSVTCSGSLRPSLLPAAVRSTVPTTSTPAIATRSQAIVTDPPKSLITDPSTSTETTVTEATTEAISQRTDRSRTEQSLESGQTTATSYTVIGTPVDASKKATTTKQSPTPEEEETEEEINRMGSFEKYSISITAVAIALGALVALFSHRCRKTEVVTREGNTRSRMSNIYSGIFRYHVNMHTPSDPVQRTDFVDSVNLEDPELYSFAKTNIQPPSLQRTARRESAPEELVGAMPEPFSKQSSKVLPETRKINQLHALNVAVMAEHIEVSDRKNTNEIQMFKDRAVSYDDVCHPTYGKSEYPTKQSTAPLNIQNPAATTGESVKKLAKVISQSRTTKDVKRGNVASFKEDRRYDEMCFQERFSHKNTDKQNSTKNPSSIGADFAPVRVKTPQMNDEAFRAQAGEQPYEDLNELEMECTRASGFPAETGGFSCHNAKSLGNSKTGQSKRKHSRFSSHKRRADSAVCNEKQWKTLPHFGTSRAFAVPKISLERNRKNCEEYSDDVIVQDNPKYADDRLSSAGLAEDNVYETVDDSGVYELAKFDQ